MGAVARRRSRRASGTLTLTRPGSSPGGWSFALAGSFPVSRQAAGWAARLAAAGASPGGAGRGRAGGGDGQQRLGRTWTARCAGGRSARSGPGAGPGRPAPFPAAGILHDGTCRRRAGHRDVPAGADRPGLASAAGAARRRGCPASGDRPGRIPAFRPEPASFCINSRAFRHAAPRPRLPSALSPFPAGPARLSRTFPRRPPPCARAPAWPGTRQSRELRLWPAVS